MFSTIARLRSDNTDPRLFTNQKRIFFFLALSACSALALVFWITTTHKVLVAQTLLESPSLLLWNLLPTLLAVFLLYFLSGRALFSAILLHVVWILFAAADVIKISMRQEPLLPTDLTLVKEALTIVKTFPLTQLLLIICCIVFALVLLVAAACFRRNARLSYQARLLGVAAVGVIAVFLNQLVYADRDLYDGYPVIENPYFQVNQYNTRGLVYSFFHQCNIMHLETPETYQEAIYSEKMNMEMTAPNSELPHIIMIMGEAYSDLSENPHLNFEGYADPMEEFGALCAKENAVSGHIVVPNFGGGTSNTEFDVLTGMPTCFLDTALPSYNFIHHKIDALPYRLSQIGYETVSIHPGYAWFYNRQNVYPDMGFETSYFLEDSFDLSTQGVSGYIKEDATMDKILSVLDEHLETSDAPLFSFTVTIQNHGPYENKYGTLAQNFSTDIPLTDSQSDLLTQYFYGMLDADAQIGRLVDYAENSDEPIVLVYFGDHLPGFSNGMEFFDLLEYPIDANGTPEEQLAVYETPFVIWANDSAADLCNFSDHTTQANLPENNCISAFYLAALLTELLGIDGLSPYYDELNALRRDFPVLSELYHMDANGNFLDTLPQNQQVRLDTLIGWEYYLLFDRQIATTQP